MIMIVKMYKYIGGMQTTFVSPHGNHTINGFIERGSDGEVSAAVLVDGQCVYATSDPQYTNRVVAPETLVQIIKHVTGINVEYTEVN
jgi:hypothetical protein